MKITFNKKVIQHFIAIAVFYLLTIFFFSPVFFDNKNINQQDILQWQGSVQEIKEFRATTGEEPLWTNSMFGGMPAYMIDVDWSNDIVEFLQSAYSLWLPHPVRLVFASMVSYYILLLAFGVTPYLAIVGAVGFAFTSYNMICLVAGHNARLGAIAFAPLILAGIHKAYDGKKRIGFALAALGLAMHLRINHLQITYYLLLIIIIYAIARLVVETQKGLLKPFLKHSFVLILAALLGLGTFFGEFWATYDYAKYTQRGRPELTAQKEAKPNADGLDKSYAFNHSNGIFEPVVMFIPNFYGGAMAGGFDTDGAAALELQKMGVPRQQVAQQLNGLPAYWGNQPGTLPYYAGAIIIFLAVLGGIVLPGKQKYWMFVVIAFGIALTWGKNFSSFNYFLFDYFPGYNKFRSVTFALFMPLLCLPLLGMLGLQLGLEKSFDKQWMKGFYIALGATGGFALLAIMFAGMGGYASPNDAGLEQYPRLLQALRIDRASLLRADAFRSLLFIVAAGACIYFWAKGKLSAVWAPVLLVVVTSVDVISVSRRYLNDKNFTANPARQFFAPSEADQVILSDKDYYRVFNLNDPFNDAQTSYFHHSLGGYHAAKLRRYQDLIEYCLSGEANQLYSTVQAGSRDFSGLGVVNMLNTRYFKFGDNKGEVLRNSDANGPAWFVSNVYKVNSADEEIDVLCGTDTKSVAIIDATKFDVAATEYDDSGTIALQSYAPNKLVYKSSSSSEALAIFSEIYYPEGWVARIDGNEVPILRADYVLRALQVPAGDHEIVFTFEPVIYSVGNKVMLGSSFILLIVVVLVFGYQVRKMLFDQA
ncbi:YfhO family protein [uncultured Imperialibacter sp.]|uniref:YfhO family protein n=1 Tax=uncultured Imperialibacter sp. TaxID=1672639 RepID=UPI0030D76597